MPMRKPSESQACLMRPPCPLVMFDHGTVPVVWRRTVRTLSLTSMWSTSTGEKCWGLLAASSVGLLPVGGGSGASPEKC